MATIDTPALSGDNSRISGEILMARKEWQLAEIEAGLSEADRGDFASDAEVAGVIAKYLRPAPHGEALTSGSPAIFQIVDPGDAAQPDQQIAAGAHGRVAERRQKS